MKPRRCTSPSLVVILSQNNSKFSQPTSLRSILSALLSASVSPKWSIPLCFAATVSYAFFISPMCATCSAHRILLCSTILIIGQIGEESKLWSFSLRSCFQRPSFLLDPNIITTSVCVVSSVLYLTAWVQKQWRNQLPSNCRSHSVRPRWDDDVR
jgi:hypothetical protein